MSSQQQDQHWNAGATEIQHLNPGLLSCRKSLQPKGYCPIMHPPPPPTEGRRRRPRSFLFALSLSWTKRCILTKLLGRGIEVIKLLWPWPHFQGHTSTLNYRMFTKKKACLHPISWTEWRILAKLHVLLHWDGLKIWLDFGDLDLIFKVTTL